MKWNHVVIAGLVALLGLSSVRGQVSLPVVSVPAGTESVVECAGGNIALLPLDTTSVTVECSAAAVVAPSPAPVTALPVQQFAWFYGQASGVSPAVMSSRHNVFIAADGQKAYRDQLLATGEPASNFYRYVLANEIRNSTDFWSNNVVSNRAAWDYVNKQEAWFLHDQDNKRICSFAPADPYPSCMMHPGNREWQQYVVAHILRTQGDWSHVFLDNLDGSLVRARRNAGAATVREFGSDWSVANEQYRQAVEQYLKAVTAGLRAARPDLRIIANITNSSLRTWDRYLLYLDGMLEEAAFAGWSDDLYADPVAYAAELTALEKQAQAGKIVIAVTQGDPFNVSRNRFAYASYLLVAGAPTFSYRYGSAADYRVLSWLPEYDRALGAPLGPRYQNNGVWYRDYELARVSVDPVRHTAAITVR